MNPKLIIVLLVAVITGGLFALDYQHGVRVPTPVSSTFQPAPELSLPTLDGDEMIRLSDYRGRYVLINAWASWCAPCLEEFPDLLKLASDHANELTLFTISVDEKPEDSNRFLARLPQSNTLPNVVYGWDEKRQLTQNTLHIVRYPESILINPQGQMIQKFAGALTPEQFDQIRALISTN